MTDLNTYVIHPTSLLISSGFTTLLTVGSDLIYGPKAVEAMQALLFTVSALLRRESESVPDTDTEDFSIDTSPQKRKTHYRDDLVTESSIPSPEGVPPLTSASVCLPLGIMISTQPSFLLAYMRSGSVPLEDLFLEAAAHGLQAGVLEDYTW